MPFVPVDQAPVAAPPKPAGRFVPLESPDFSQFQQEAPPVETPPPTETVRPTPRQPLQEGVPSTSAGLFQPIEQQKRLVPGYTFIGDRKTHLAAPIEMPEFSPEIETFLKSVKDAGTLERAEIGKQIRALPKNTQEDIGDILRLRFGEDLGLNIPYTDRMFSKNIDINPGPVESFVRSLTGEVAPTASAMTAAAAAMRYTPGGLAVKVPASLASMYVASQGTRRLQDIAEARVMGERGAADLAAQREADLRVNPTASFAGQLAPSLAFLRPSASGLGNASELASSLLKSGGTAEAKQVWSAATPEAKAYLVNGLFGGTISGGLETLRESTTPEGIDQEALKRILIAIGAGLTQTKPTRLGRAVGLPEIIPDSRNTEAFNKAIKDRNFKIRNIDDEIAAQNRLSDVASTAREATAAREQVRAAEAQAAATSEADRISSSIPLDEAGRRIVGNEPTGLRLPDILTAEDAAAQGLPFQRGAVTRNAADEAAIAAGRTAEEANIQTDVENTIQGLVNEWSQATGAPYEALVKYRQGKTDLEFMNFIRGKLSRLRAQPQEGVSNAKQPNTETGPVSPEQGIAPEQAPAGEAAKGNTRQAPAQEVAVKPEIASRPVFSDAPEGQIPVLLRKADGSVEEAVFNGYWEGYPGEPANIGRKIGPESWSHGPIRPDETIIESASPLPPRQSEIPAQPPAPEAADPTKSAAAPRAAETAVPDADGPVFTRAEIEVARPQTSRRKRANGTDGEVRVEIRAPSKITNPDNWSRLGDTNRTRATVEGRLTFETGKPPAKTDAAWVVRGGNMGSENVIARNLTYKQAIDRAKDFVESANVRRETVTPSTDPVVGTDINGTPIHQSSKGTYYTFENGRVRTGPAFAEPGPTTTPEPVSPTAETAPTPKPAPKASISFKEWSDAIEAGASIEDLPSPKLIGNEQRRAFNRINEKRLKDLGSAGRINITPGTTTAAGGALGGFGGAAYGITQGETPEERLKNAALYATVFGAAGAFGGRKLGKFATTKAGHHVGRHLGVIEDFPVLSQDISNTRIQLQRIGNMLSRGSRLRKPFFDAMRRTEAQMASMTDEAKILLADARAKINASTSKGQARDALEAKLNEVFSDITKVGELPENLRPVANRIYQIRLKNAARIAALDGITDTTRDTVLENGGNYLARKYAIFNLKNGLEARAYRDSLPTQDVEAALDAIQEAWKPKPKTREQQKLAADMLETVANDRENAVAVIKSLRPWMTEDDSARLAAWIAGGKQSGSDVARKMRALYTELINPTEVSRDEARGLLNEFLDRDNFAGFTLGRKQIGGKDVTSLYRKKEIDPRLRKVLGEVKDPLANAFQSVENQANIIARDKQQKEFIRIGEAMGIMTRDPDVALQKGMRPFVEGGTQLNHPYDNYDGVFIYPWLRDEFKGSVIQSDDLPKVADITLKGIKSATALFKWLKLIPAPDSRSVNLIGAWWNNAINGRGINPMNGKTLEGVKSILLANGILSPNGSLNTQKLLALRETLITHRVLDESVLGRDFIENARRSLVGKFFDQLDETAQREIDNPVLRKAYMTGKFVASGKEFAAGDDIMRVAGFLSEHNRYRRAFPTLSEPEIDALVGRVMNQTGMTYSEVPYALRELSQLGVVEPFISFPYSVFRSTANSVRLGMAEMADGIATGNAALTKIGATRLTALGIGATLASGYGLSRAINEKNGVTPEQEEAAKVFAPGYVKDSPLAFDAPIKNGKATFVQMNYLLPTSLMTEAVEDGIRKAQEDGLASGLGAAGQSVGSQFTGMFDEDRPKIPPVPRTIGVALGLINEDSFGRPIYNPEDPDKLAKIGKQMGYDWSPGFWSKAVRLYKANNPEAQDPQSGRVYTNREEFMRFLGRRATTVDAKQVFPSKAYQLNEEYQNAVRLYQEGVRKIGTEGPEADAAYAKAEGVITEKFNELVRLRDAARELGMNDETIIAGFVRGGLQKRLVGQVMQSINIPPPKEVLDAKIERKQSYREAYRAIANDPTSDAQALVAKVRARNIPQDQFLRELEVEWKRSGVGIGPDGKMTKEFADALRAEIQRNR